MLRFERTMSSPRFGKRPSQRRALTGFTPRLEALEDRTVPSTIVWTNRGGPGNDSDLFGAAFGANANAARGVIDAVLDHWERIIPSFNTAAAGGVPADTFHVEFSMEQLPAGTNGQSVLGPVDATGRPRRGSITLDFNGSSNNNPGVFNWFVDPTPTDHAEFLRTDPGLGSPYRPYVGQAHDGSPAEDKLDLYTVATHEMYHLLGLHFSPALRLNSTPPGLVTNTGVSDGPGTLFAFNGPSMQLLLTSSNGFGATSGPSHMASSGQAIPARAQFPNGLRGGGGLGTLATGQGVRALPSLVDSLFLREAYLYTTVDPEAFGTFYSVLNSTTGELTVRGQFGNFLTDQVRVTQSNGVITTSVDVAGDLFPNGTPIDASVSTYPVASVSSIRVIGTDADAITIGVGVTPPVTVTGVAENFNSLSLEGDDSSQIFTLNATTLSGGPLVPQAGGGTSITYSGISTIGVEGRGGTDFVNVHAAAADINSVILKGGTGNDTFNISPTARNLSNVTGVFLSIVGEDGTDALIVHDEARSSAGTYAGFSSQIISDLSGEVEFDSTMEQVSFNAGLGADTLNVEGGGGAAHPIVVNAGPGTDTFHLTPDTDNFDQIFGQYTLDGGASGASLIVHDTARTTANNVVFTNTSISRPGSGRPPITIGAINSLEYHAGSGDDALDASAVSFSVTLRGNGGNDSLTGGSNNDSLFGSVGGDTLVGNGGNGGNDFLAAGFTRAIDTLLGGAGDDTASEAGAGDIVDLGSGEDGLLIVGTSKNDVIRVGRLLGPNGAQAVISSNGEVAVHDYLNGETITVLAGRGNDVVTLEASAGVTWQALFNGEDGNDVLIGSSRADILRGGAGNDELRGGEGDDELYGDDGNDDLYGENGADRLEGGRGRDILVGGAGADRVFAGDGELDKIFADLADLLIDLDKRDHLIWW